MCGCTPTGKCPAGANCGTVPDGCGGNVACGGACKSPQSCGGGGTANVCGCTPLTCADYTCGNGLPNGCGGTISCGICGGGGGGCFAAETPVLMADGTMRAIVELRRGDMIMGYDAATGAIAPRAVDRVVIHPAEASADGIVLIDGELRATRNHPLLVGGHAVRADALKAGDALHVASAGSRRFEMLPSRVTNVQIVPGGIVSYDVKTTPAGGYIVGTKHVIALIKQ
jgi:hypothetical protein